MKVGEAAPQTNGTEGHRWGVDAEGRVLSKDISSDSEG
jgi:hypothetical protein